MVDKVNDVIENSLKLINTQLGRDKTCRFVQYFVKFIVPTIAARGPAYADTKDRLEKLQSNMSLTRKVLRFGKPLPLIKGIIDRFKAHEKKPQRNIILRTLADIFLALYFLTDHPLYFQRIGFVKMEKSTVDFIDWWNNVFWLLEAVLDIYCDIVDLHYLNLDIKEAQNALKSGAEQGDRQQVQDAKDQLKALAPKRLALILSIVRGSVDLPVIYHFMGYQGVNSQMGGFFGTISSSVSLYNLWGK